RRLGSFRPKASDKVAVLRIKHDLRIEEVGFREKDFFGEDVSGKEPGGLGHEKQRVSLRRVSSLSSFNGAMHSTEGTPPQNPGSRDHPRCTPCNKYRPDKPSACKSGVECKFCHDEHERPKKRGKRGKEAQRRFHNRCPSRAASRKSAGAHQIRRTLRPAASAGDVGGEPDGE
ncbi:unnamed protein product, partial [Effrenium voratum]